MLNLEHGGIQQHGELVPLRRAEPAQGAALLRALFGRRRPRAAAGDGLRTVTARMSLSIGRVHGSNGQG